MPAYGLLVMSLINSKMEDLVCYTVIMTKEYLVALVAVCSSVLALAFETNAPSFHMLLEGRGGKKLQL